MGYLKRSQAILVESDTLNCNKVICLQGSNYVGVDSLTVDNCKSTLCNNSPAVIIATAHPDKFSQVINNMANIPYTCSHSFEGTTERFSILTKDDNWEKEILQMLQNANL